MKRGMTMAAVDALKKMWTAGWLLALVILPGAAAAGAERGPLQVAVSVLPQSYFVKRVGGERVLVDALVTPGRSPATYAPHPDQISRLSKSDVYFRIGVPFENLLLPRLSSVAPKLLVVDTRKGVPLRKMESDHSHEAGAGSEAAQSSTVTPKEAGHDREGHDPHIWLDPLLVKIQAATICDTLTALDPAGEAAYRGNLERFAADLDALHRKLQQVLRPFAGENLYVFHPSFGYLADAYGLHQVSIEVEGKSPKGKDLHGFIRMAKASRARAIFVQPQFDQRAAAKIAAAIQGKVMALDPLSEAYLKNMEEMALTIAAALAP